MYRTAALATGAVATVWTLHNRDDLLAVANCAPRPPNHVGAYDMTPIRCEDGTTVVPWSCPGRSEQVRSLQEDEFDVLIVGAGCVGAGVAMDAASRGLRVALVEREDFSSGTSGRSSKLAHGGIRYLEKAVKELDIESFKLVNEALRERAHMLHAAPFMVRPLPIMIPIYTFWEVPYLWAGAKAYDVVAGWNSGVPHSRWISRAEALFQFPMLNRDGLKGAVIYYDGQQNDARMNVLLVLTAAQKGATVANYVNVDSLTKDKDGKLNGANVSDRLSGKSWTIKAKHVVNCTGPFADALRHMADEDVADRIVPAGGVHIILPDHLSPERMGLIVPKTKDGRVLFFLPWEGSTLCGTTDSVSELTMRSRPTEEEIHFILEESNRFLNRKVSRADVRAAWSGIRPLVTESAVGNTSKLHRNHVVETSPSGLVSCMGGKWTTYRQMAEDTVDTIIEKDATLKSAASPCVTRDMQVVGADRAGLVVKQAFSRIGVTLRETYELPKDVAHHLTHNYGTRALQIAEIGVQDPKMFERFDSRFPFINAEIVFAVEQEYACKALDILARRTRIAFLNTDAAVEVTPRIVEIMGNLLGWSKKQRQAEIDECLEFLETMR